MRPHTYIDIRHLDDPDESAIRASYRLEDGPYIRVMPVQYLTPPKFDYVAYDQALVLFWLQSELSPNAIFQPQYYNTSRGRSVPRAPSVLARSSSRGDKGKQAWEDCLWPIIPHGSLCTSRRATV